MSRSARYPERMHSADEGDHGISHTARRADAVSSTTPAAVTQFVFGFGDRKKFSPPYDVWVSRTSVNHVSHDSQKGSIASRNPVRCARIKKLAGVGGVPARTARSATATSR